MDLSASIGQRGLPCVDAAPTSKSFSIGEVTGQLLALLNLSHEPLERGNADESGAGLHDVSHDASKVLGRQ
jgi:hypothetical protein